MADLELLVVIINYKTKQMTIDCLKTVLPQLEAKHEIVVIDNSSKDGSAEAVQEWIAQNQHSNKISMIHASSNSGFSGGNNQGIALKTAANYLLLNSDTLLREQAISTLLLTAKDKPTFGLISPRLEWPDSTPQISCFRFHRPISELINAAGTSIITRLFQRWDVPIPIQKTPFSPEWTSFACVLIKAEVFKSIGEMDEGYFLYYEDTDFCKLANDAGWKTWHNPTARVVHLRGGSSDVKDKQSKKGRVPKYLYVSRTRYFAKHFGLLGPLAANTCWLIGRSVSLLLRVLGKKSSPACEKQHIDIWTHFFCPMKPFRNKK